MTQVDHQVVDTASFVHSDNLGNAPCFYGARQAHILLDPFLQWQYHQWRVEIHRHVHTPVPFQRNTQRTLAHRVQLLLERVRETLSPLQIGACRIVKESDDGGHRLWKVREFQRQHLQLQTRVGTLE